MTAAEASESAMNACSRELSVVWICVLVAFVPANCDVPPSHYHGPIVMGIPKDHCDNAQVCLCVCVCVCVCVVPLYFALLFVLVVASRVGLLAGQHSVG